MSKFTKIFAFLLVFALVAAACGDSTDATTGDPASKNAVATVSKLALLRMVIRLALVNRAPLPDPIELPFVIRIPETIVVQIRTSPAGEINLLGPLRLGALPYRSGRPPLAGVAKARGTAPFFSLKAILECAGRSPLWTRSHPGAIRRVLPGAPGPRGWRTRPGSLPAGLW